MAAEIRPLFFSGFFVSLDTGFEKGQGLLRPTGSRYSEFLAALLVIRDEERLKLVEQGHAHIVDGIEAS
jgi:hypothetical protein